MGGKFGVLVDDGKYEVVIDGEDFYANRHGERWRDLTGDKLVLCLAMELDEARAEIAAMREKTRIDPPGND